MRTARPAIRGGREGSWTLADLARRTSAPRARVSTVNAPGGSNPRRVPRFPWETGGCGNSRLTTGSRNYQTSIALTRIVRIVLAVLGCLHLCGGHWGVMQVIAWSSMIVDYSARDGWVEGAKKTFDGEHPCGMCKAISEGKKKESGSPENKLPQDSQGLVLKECVWTPVDRLTPPAALDRVPLPVPDLDPHGRSLGHRPPVPPPRRA